MGALARTVAYENGYLRSRRLDRPVISVGNVTLGGTGKTPIVAMLAEYLRDQHYNVVVLTRGYGRRSRGREVLRSEAGELPSDGVARGGDEPALLAREVPGVSIVVDADRHAAGIWATRELDADVFLLDDGFQHLRLARDLNLVAVDATDPFGGNRMPPVGRLREPLRGLRRADAVLVTRADRAFDEPLIRRVVARICGDEVPLFFASHDLTGLRPLGGGEERALDSFRSRPVGVLTAIGNPGVLLADLASAGIEVVAERLHPDHYDYTQTDVDAAVTAAREAGATALLTTEKDAVKLEPLDLSAMPVFAVRIRFRSDHEDRIKSLCLGTILRHEHHRSK
jgi:tetraacyldisaccharide 4'-kinase